MRLRRCRWLFSCHVGRAYQPNSLSASAGVHLRFPRESHEASPAGFVSTSIAMAPILPRTDWWLMIRLNSSCCTLAQTNSSSAACSGGFCRCSLLIHNLLGETSRQKARYFVFLARVSHGLKLNKRHHTRELWRTYRACLKACPCRGACRRMAVYGRTFEGFRSVYNEEHFDPEALKIDIGMASLGALANILGTPSLTPSSSQT